MTALLPSKQLDRREYDDQLVMDGDACHTAAVKSFIVEPIASLISSTCEALRPGAHSTGRGGSIMTTAQFAFTQETADRVAGKLQALYNGLDPDEQALLQRVLLAGGHLDEVQGYAKYDLTLHADVTDKFGGPVGPGGGGAGSGPVTTTVGISFTIHF
jgi:hypothetical protein